ncbi:MAG: helix-hairpin-helix domain-containing protein [Planctomycetes bacterium]|nr:helix-hairpin-helix domain-containing protein [Planctomycetota bacterium]
MHDDQGSESDVRVPGATVGSLALGERAGGRGADARTNPPLVRSSQVLVSVWGIVTCLLAVRMLVVALTADADGGIEVRALRIDLNRAPYEELLLLPGVGPSRAEAIVLDRLRRGPFRRFGDLHRVEGLGQDTLDRIAPFVHPIDT